MGERITTTMIKKGVYNKNNNNNSNNYNKLAIGLI